MNDIYDKKKRSEVMSKIRSKDTRPELVLRKKLWKMGLRYRINYKKAIGKPDIVFINKKIAVFIDGDFWHGYLWKAKGKVPKKKYWYEKIKKNVERDEQINRTLKKEGWIVIRFWEHDILKNAEKCVAKIVSTF